MVFKQHQLYWLLESCICEYDLFDPAMGITDGKGDPAIGVNHGNGVKPALSGISIQHVIIMAYIFPFILSTSYE